MKTSLTDIMNWNKRFRLKFVNSISGYKAVHLIGTKAENGDTNLAIFNSIVHIGSSPPLIGFIMRPLTVERNTYTNIKATGYYTINHVHRSFLKQAHYTSIKFPSSTSEFDKCNLTPEFSDSFSAPFVGESKIKLGLKLESDIEIDANGTRLIVGEVQEVFIEDNFVEEDGQIDLEQAKDICVTGLNQYSVVSKTEKMPYARLSEVPDFRRKKRPDNVVFDKETQSYNANLLAYGTNVGAPSILAKGLSRWINTNVNSFNHSFKNKIELIKEEYQVLIEEYEINDMLYKANMNFEPIIGKEYYLYFSDKNGENFLSIIPPDSWGMEHLGAFVLNADKIWKKTEYESR
jgi:flavin reductase (DIM6/NTAB) family NADH-FMN oxidoreductase RutF